MPVTPSDYPGGKPERDLEGIPWVRVGALLGTIGAAFVWIVTHWAEVKPVLESPAVVLLAMMTIYGLGGLSIYWIVSRPLEQRLLKNESLVSELRKVERALMKDGAEKAARIAALEVTVGFLTEQLADVRQSMQRMQSEASIANRAEPKATGRRPRKTQS